MSKVAGSTQNQLRQWHLNQLYWLHSKSATSVALENQLHQWHSNQLSAALKISCIGSTQNQLHQWHSNQLLIAHKVSYIGSTQINYLIAHNIYKAARSVA